MGEKRDRGETGEREGGREREREEKENREFVCERETKEKKGARVREVHAHRWYLLHGRIILGGGGGTTDGEAANGAGRFDAHSGGTHAIVGLDEGVAEVVDRVVEEGDQRIPLEVQVVGVAQVVGAA